MRNLSEFFNTNFNQRLKYGYFGAYQAIYGHIYFKKILYG